MKRIICFVLATIFILSMSSCKNSNEPTETEVPCGNGHSFTITYTNDCETDGYKISTCSVCGFEQKEEAKATGHEFKKNYCVNCDFKATKIEELPLEYRQKLAEEIKLIAPFSSDLESLSYFCDIYILTLKDLKNCENAIQSAINKFNSVPMVRVLDENGRWIWVQHEPSLIEARNELEQAKKQKEKTEELLETLKISMDVNAQGAAWNVIIEELESETTSNKKIESRLLAVFFAYSYQTGNTNPYWKQDIFDTFKEKTGLEIDMSQALS